MLTFFSGLLLGLALDCHPRGLPGPKDGFGASVGSTGAPEAEPVRGVEAAAEPARVAVRPANAAPHPPRGVANAQPEASDGRPSDVARAALRFTVFLDGHGVYGAGILLDDRGHVLTSFHVIDGRDELAVSLADGSVFEARVLEHDRALDVALLKIDTARDPALASASITTVHAGDDLYAMGAPRKMRFSLSRGMASFVGRAFDGVRYLQTDLPLNGGSSGGPIMNARGQVVAMSAFVLKNSEGLSFALPIDYAYRRFADRLSGAPVPEGAASDAFGDWLNEMDRISPGGEPRAE